AGHDGAPRYQPPGAPGGPAAGRAGVAREDTLGQRGYDTAYKRSYTARFRKPNLTYARVSSKGMCSIDSSMARLGHCVSQRVTLPGPALYAAKASTMLPWYRVSRSAR